MGMWLDKLMAAPAGHGRRGVLPMPMALMAFITLCTLGTAVLMVQVPLPLSTLIVAGLVIFIAAFVNAELGLYVVVFSMLLSPEFGAGSLGGSSGTTASRGVTLRAEDLLLVLLGFSWLTHMAVHKDLGLVRRTVLNKPIGYYVVACLFATSMGFLTGHVSGITGFFYVLKYVEYFVIYFVVANYLKSRVQVQRLVFCMLLTAFIVSLVALAQIPSGQRVSAPFEGDRAEPNTLGGYLLFVGALVAGLFFSLSDRRQRRVLLALLGVMFVPFLFTLSRGSYLALPFVYGAMIVMQRSRRRLLVLLLILAVVGGSLVMPAEVRNRIMYTFHQRTQAGQVKVGGVALDTSTSARLDSWRHALEAAAMSPLWGYGVTGYGFLDAQYPRILVETGLMGFVLFGVLIARVFREAARVWREAGDPLYRGLASGLIAGTVGLLVHALGANTFILVRVMEPFWLTVGLVVCSQKLDAEVTTPSATETRFPTVDMAGGR